MSRRPHFLLPLLHDGGRECRLFLVGRDEALAVVIETAFDSASRRKGLLGRTSLPRGQALIIAPCSLVHTFRMQFDIDVIHAGRDGRVVKVHQRLKPGRVSGAFRAFAVIEMAAGATDEVPVGARLEVR
jgi:uncharacterized membrane protein (UPF0127 family)